MKEYTSFSECSDDIRDWIVVNKPNLDEFLFNKLVPMAATGNSPVAMVAGFCETVYANQDDFPTEAKEIASAAAIICESHGLFGMSEGGRGSKIASILNGATVSYEHPVPSDSHKKPAASAPVEAPVEGD